MIGGLLRRDSSDGGTLVPFLNKIPIIGAAFRSKSGADSERELIVFITPHILDDEDRGVTKFNNRKSSRNIVREKSSQYGRKNQIDQELSTFENRRF